MDKKASKKSSGEKKDVDAIRHTDDRRLNATDHPVAANDVPYQIGTARNSACIALFGAAFAGNRV